VCGSNGAGGRGLCSSISAELRWAKLRFGATGELDA